MENELELRVSQALVENQQLIDLLVKKNEGARGDNSRARHLSLKHGI